MKTVQKIFIWVNIILTLLFVAAVDSLSNFQIIALGAFLGVLWYLLREMSARMAREEEQGL